MTTLVLACGALAREIQAVIDLGQLDLALHCLPAGLHNRPQAIPAAVGAAIAEARGRYDRILVGYADCGTGGALDRVLADAGVGRLPGPHCYALFSGLDAFAAAAEADMTAFFLTDFLARQFDTLVIEGLGLDRHPELRDAYFGRYERLVYLAQTDDPGLDSKAEAAAQRLGLAYERRFTGYGELAGCLARAAA